VRSDLAKALRRIRPERRSGTWARRPDDQLPFVGQADRTGGPLLLDTTVYLDVLQGSTPPEVDLLLGIRPLIHHTVVVAELSHLFGRLDPRRPQTADILSELAGTLGDIPPHRLQSTTSPQAMIEAGILAGLLFRHGGLTAGREVAALNDATLYVHALRQGCTVLTRNIGDFDFFDQVVPSGRVLFYRAQ